MTNGPSAVNKVDFTEDEFVLGNIRASQHPATTAEWNRWERSGRRLGMSPYTAATQPCCSGSWCRAAAPAEGRSPRRSPAAAACWHQHTRTSWPSRNAAGSPSAGGFVCRGTWCGCTCREGKAERLVKHSGVTYSGGISRRHELMNSFGRVDVVKCLRWCRVIQSRSGT